VGVVISKEKLGWSSFFIQIGISKVWLGYVGFSQELKKLLQVFSSKSGNKISPSSKISLQYAQTFS
jgi:hypothetical protein